MVFKALFSQQVADQLSPSMIIGFSSNEIGQQVAAQLPRPQLTKQPASQLPTSKVVMPDLIRHPEFTFKHVNTGFRIKCGMTVNEIPSIRGIYGFNNLVGSGYEF